MSKEEYTTKKIFGVLLPEWMDEEVLKKLIYGLLSLMITVLVSSVFVWPKFGDLYKEEKELKRLRTSLEVLSNSVNQIEGFRENLGEEKIATLKIAVPTTFDPGLILSSLRQVGANAGVVLDTYEIDGGVIRTDASEIDIDSDLVSLKKHKVDLRLVGESDKLIKFIDLMSNSLPFSVISELSLSEVSKLFSVRGVSQLEMEVTYFESRLVKVEMDKVVVFTDKNEQLLDEVVLYSKPQVFRYETGSQAQTERRKSVFGF
jgi:hypothetical protein